MLRYQRFLAVASVVVFATNLTIFLYAKGMSPVPPLAWVELFALACLPVLLRPGALRAAFVTPLAAWCAGFLALSALWFSLGPPSDLAWPSLRQRVLTVLFLLTMSVCFSDVRVHRTVRLAFAWAVLVATAVNVYDLLHPLQLGVTIGRAAGFYMNPNTAASAILLFTLLAYDALSARHRSVVLVVGLAGVLLTASRGAAATSVIVLVVLWTRGALQLRNAAIAVSLLVVVATGILAASGSLSTLSLALEATSSQRERLSGSTESEGDDFSNESRREVAERAVDMFLTHPGAGTGIGATAQTTHNMYLMFVAEHGAIGVLIFPSLLVALTWGARGRASTTALATAIFFACWAMFSHNVLDEFQLLMGMAFLGSMCSASRRTSLSNAHTLLRPAEQYA
ncbi:MAG: O-antigen ligase family protein [Gemmatimonadaceae bacterium]